MGHNYSSNRGSKNEDIDSNNAKNKNLTRTPTWIDSFKSVSLESLTPSQKCLVTQSWAIIRDDIEKMGSILFLELFAHNVDFQDAFAIFRGRHMEDIKADSRLASHGIRVMSIVDKIVSRINDSEKAARVLVELGQRHMAYDIDEKFIPVLGRQFMITIKPTLDSKNLWTDELENAWTFIVIFICQKMTDGLRSSQNAINN